VEQDKQLAVLEMRLFGIRDMQTFKDRPPVLPASVISKCLQIPATPSSLLMSLNFNPQVSHAGALLLLLLQIPPNCVTCPCSTSRT
jgi:hypothetical protein